MPALTLVIDAAVAIKCFGVATSYLIVIGDLMPDVMQQLGVSGTGASRELWVFLGFTVVVPLCCLRNLDSLKFTSTMSICFVFFLMLLVVLYSAKAGTLDPCAAHDDDGPCVGDFTNGQVNIHTFQVLSIFVFGFTCQQVQPFSTCF
jgi:amino acid permease